MPNNRWKTPKVKKSSPNFVASAVRGPVFELFDNNYSKQTAFFMVLRCQWTSGNTVQICESFHSSKIIFQFLTSRRSVRSGPSLGGVGYSCSPAGEGPPPHIWPGGRGLGAELGTLGVEWANVWSCAKRCSTPDHSRVEHSLSLGWRTPELTDSLGTSMQSSQP